MIGIVVISHNSWEISNQFVQLIKKYTNSSLYKMFWVDNGSTDETPEKLSKIINLPLDLSLQSTNLGVIGARNLGFKWFLEQSDSLKYLIFLDNDQMVKDRWLEQHLSVLAHGYGLVGMESWQMSPSFLPVQKNNKLSQWFSYLSGCGFTVTRETAKTIGSFDERFNPAYFEDPDYCYDRETCVLTKRGIVPFPELKQEDYLLTLSDNNIQEYQQPLQLIRKFEKKLLHFKNQQIDICCSEDQHLLIGYRRLPWKNIDKGLFLLPEYIKAKDICGKLSTRQSRYYIPKAAGIWEREQNQIIINNQSYEEEIFCSFMGWFLSEGYVYPENKRNIRGGYEIIICQLKETYKKDIRNIISKMGFKYHERFDRFYFSDKGIYNYLQQFGKSKNKYIPEEIKNASKNGISAFITAYIKGDGSFKNNGFSLFTSSDRMKSDLVELLVKLGRSFTFSRHGGGKTRICRGKEYNCNPVWHIQSYNKNFAYLNSPTIIDYNDYVYDVTVQNHRIFIIRNGKGCWSSNCFRAYDAKISIGWNIRARIIHLQHQTLGKMQDKTDRFLNSYKEFREKWKDHQVPHILQQDIQEFSVNY